MTNIYLSIIVPVYNEEKRISPFLEELLYFSETSLNGCEVIIVDDGSTDGSIGVIKEIIKGRKDVRLVGYSPNKGKGEAIKFGIINSKGEKIIFIDADGSIRPDSLPDMINKINEHGFAIGNRSLEDSEIDTIFIRRALGMCFNLIVRLLYRTGTRDHLCGFKGFNRNIGEKLFNGLHQKRWLFDVEIIYKAKQNNFEIGFVPLRWTYSRDSKIRLCDPIKMFLGLLILRAKLLKR